MKLLTTALKAILPRRVCIRLRNAIYENRWADARAAKRLARSKKRVDICAAYIAQFLHLAGGYSVVGRTCLEIGSGWVLSHALVLHLLGAKRVIASDVRHAAHPDTLQDALRYAFPQVVRDLLAPFDSHARIRERLDRVMALPSFTFESLLSIGIEYRAPVDFSQASLSESVDTIFSFSVLEHVPVASVVPLLANLALTLKPGGAMFHAIHMEDHWGSQTDPFAFLAEPAEQFTADMQARRGNRLRQSQWEHIFNSIPNLQTRYLYVHRRLDKPLPATIDPSVKYLDEQDLRVSHLGPLSVRC